MAAEVGGRAPLPRAHRLELADPPPPVLLANCVAGEWPGSTSFASNSSSSSASDAEKASMAVLARAVPRATSGIGGQHNARGHIDHRSRPALAELGHNRLGHRHHAEGVGLELLGPPGDVGVASEAPNPPMPALLTSTSIGPLASKAAAMDSGLVVERDREADRRAGRRRAGVSHWRIRSSTMPSQWRAVSRP